MSTCLASTIYRSFSYLSSILASVCEMSSINQVEAALLASGLLQCLSSYAWPLPVTPFFVQPLLGSPNVPVRAPMPSTTSSARAASTFLLLHSS